MLGAVEVVDMKPWQKTLDKLYLSLVIVLVIGVLWSGIRRIREEHGLDLFRQATAEESVRRWKESLVRAEPWPVPDASCLSADGRPFLEEFKGQPPSECKPMSFFTPPNRWPELGEYLLLAAGVLLAAYLFRRWVIWLFVHSP